VPSPVEIIVLEVMVNQEEAGGEQARLEAARLLGELPDRVSTRCFPNC